MPDERMRHEQYLFWLTMLKFYLIDLTILQILNRCVIYPLEVNFGSKPQFSVVQYYVTPTTVHYLKSKLMKGK